MLKLTTHLTVHVKYYFVHIILYSKRIYPTHHILNITVKVTVLESWEYNLASLTRNILFKLKLYANFTEKQFKKKIGDHMVTRFILTEFRGHTP